MSDIDLDAIEARARDWRDYRAGKELVLALIARVREQEQEIARLRLDEHRLNWLDVHPHIVVADRGEHGFEWAARDVDGGCIWLGGLRRAIDRGREIEANVTAEAHPRA